MNNAEPISPTHTNPAVATITTPGIITYVTFTFAVALLLSLAITPIWIMLALVIGYAACLGYRKFQPDDTTSQFARIANAVYAYGAGMLNEAKRARAEGGNDRFWRFFLVPRRNGGLGFVGLFLISLCLITICFSADPKKERVAINERPIEEALLDETQRGLNANKQAFFENIHPIGTAKSVTVHDVTVVGWKHGKNTNRFEDILQLSIRYTIYWEGPLTTNGYTKVTQIYDNEAQRYVSCEILATNGTTKNEVGSALGDIGVKLLYEALTSE